MLVLPPPGVQLDDISTAGQFYGDAGVCGNHFTKPQRDPWETYSPIQRKVNLIHQRALHSSKPWHKNQVSPLTGVDNQEETIQVTARFFFFLSYLS